jgi:hypothetical protein
MAFSSFREGESDGMNHDRRNKPVCDRELKYLVIKKYEGN